MQAAHTHTHTFFSFYNLLSKNKGIAMCVREHHCQSGNEDPSQSPPQFHGKFTGSETHTHTFIHAY